MKKGIAIVFVLIVTVMEIFGISNDEKIIKALSTIPEIKKIQAVTEDHDPNGNLNKTYISCVYFESSSIDQTTFDEGSDVIDKGTSCGGCIEMYPTKDQATSRNEYLGMFDGSMFSSGGHTIYNSLVIRTSSRLTAFQQKNLEQSIISSFKKRK